MPDHSRASKPNALVDTYYMIIAHVGHWRDLTAGVWRRAWWSEVVVVAAFVVLLGLTAVEATMTGHLFDWLLFGAEAAFLGALVRYVIQLAWEREHVDKLMSVTPTGAPRVANVRCSEDREHRFIYGNGGWQEAGPAVRAEETL